MSKLEQRIAQLEAQANQPHIAPGYPMNMMPNQDDEIDLAELWRAIWAGKLQIIIITAVFAIASVAYALYLPNIYKASTVLAPAAKALVRVG